MKVNFRSRKIVLQGGDTKEHPRLPESLSKLIPKKVVLRRMYREEDQSEKPTEEVRQVTQSKEADGNVSRQSKSDIIAPTNYVDFDPPTEFLQARDRRTFLRYDFVQRAFSLETEKQRLNEWLGEMHFKVVSSSFNLYLTNELTFQQVKVHCCQNLLLNILNFLQNLTQGSDSNHRSRVSRPLSSLELSEILKHINETLYKNLAYMQIKYPLTKDTKPNKSLQSLIFKINNLGNDEHDLIMKSGIEFKLKKEDNYTPEIMRFLNFIIYKQGELCKKRGRNNKKQLTYYEYFYETMEKIFAIIYKPEYEVSDKKGTEEEIKENPAAIFAQILLHNSGEEIEDESSKNKELKEYKEKVMKYTHFIIGQKFTSNTETYTEQEIQTEIFDVKNSSILRVLTKWTEQLQTRILSAQEQILKRPFRFKKDKQHEFSKLSANQKNDLYQQTKHRAKQVNAFNEQLKENYNQIEALLSSHLKQESSMNHIPKNEYKVGYFCSKMQAAASSTLMSYLNKIIHILLQIPEELKKSHANDNQYLQNMDINLITFKIADLFRCKIKSREAEIIRIFKEIKQISERGEPFKIVRIKDRLSLGTKDILINVIFMNTFLCEIQLAIEEYMETKQMSYDSFSHFLYEMNRSRLGPIMESACTWAQFDQRSKIFRPLNHENRNLGKLVTHSCGKNYFINNNYPFVCSLCEKFYSTQEGLVMHRKCNLCRTYYECSLCIFNRMTPEQVSRMIGLDDKLGVFVEEFSLWNYSENMVVEFPKFGLLTSKKMKKPNIVFFQTLIFKYDAYIIKTLDTAQIEIIEKIQNNSAKIWKRISESYIIYEWKQKRFINITITPNVIKRLNEEEKKKRQMESHAKKEEKQRKKAELQAKRKEEQERRKEYFEKDKEEKEDKQGKKGKKDGDKGEENHSDLEGEGSVYSETGQRKPSKRPKTTEEVKTRYHEKIAKKNESFKFRVIIKTGEGCEDILVLGTFLSESIIRNKLKQMTNKNILQKFITQKIEVLFLEQEYIHDEMDDEGQLTEAEKVELRQTLERVSEIYFDNNFIETIRLLQSMTNLKVAHLSHNKISSLSSLSNLKHLNELILQNNQIRGLQDLINKPDLVELNLNRNQISSLTDLRNLQEGDFGKLRNFYINDNQIGSMEGLQMLTSLVRVDLAYNRIDQIYAITTLVHLYELDLSYNNLTSLAGLQNYGNLRRLYLNNNKIRTMSRQLSSLQNLNVLQMASNKIKKIKNINSGQITKSLKHLNLSSNSISKMEGLDGLENLNVLNLSGNEIESIGNNYLDWTNLERWDLSNNCIEELSIDDVEKYMPCLKELKLNSNPLVDSEGNRRVQKVMEKVLGHLKISRKQTRIEQ